MIDIVNSQWDTGGDMMTDLKSLRDHIENLDWEKEYKETRLREWINACIDLQILGYPKCLIAEMVGPRPE